MSGAFSRLYDPYVTHTRVLLVTVSVNHFLSAGMTSPFRIHVPTQLWLWRNSVDDSSFGASGRWIGVHVTLIRSAPSYDSVTLAGVPVGNLYSMVSCLQYFFEACPYVLARR